MLRARIPPKQTNYKIMQSAWPASTHEVPKVSTKCTKNVRNRWQNAASVKTCNQSLLNEENVQSAWLDGKTYPKLSVTCPQKINTKTAEMNGETTPQDQSTKQTNNTQSAWPASANEAPKVPPK